MRMTSSSHVSLKVRQQPLSALVTLDGKEKTRKPIDPPPIVEIKVRSDMDPYKHYLVSPYFFMYATLLSHDPNNPHAEEQSEDRQRQPGAMLGQLCSSLHRLKDVDNQDGGFFIFGDLSVRKLGWHKLRFALYDVSKAAENAAFIKDVVSEPFQVVAAKDFHGMEESSYLSRAFSDQGVRLRLRKEPRSIASAHRRGLSKYSPPQPQKPQEPQNPYAQTQPNERYADSARPLKRQRSDSDFADNASAYPPSQMPRTSYAGFAGSTLSQSFGQYKPDPQDRMNMGYEQGSMGYNIRGTNSYPPPGSSLSGYSNPLHQPGPSPLPANTGLGNISEHGPSSSVPRPLNNYYGSTGTALNYGSYSGNYQGQTGNQYASTSRTSSDGYPNIVGLQTPTSMTDFAASLPSGHDSGYMPATSGPMSVGAGTGAHTPVQSHHQAQDYSSLSGSYTHAPATYVHSSPSYQTAPSQSQHSHHSSLDHMPSYSSAMPGASLPATNMLLGESLPQNFYQQDEASYPTPTHTKQAPWS